MMMVERGWPDSPSHPQIVHWMCSAPGWGPLGQWRVRWRPRPALTCRVGPSGRLAASGPIGAHAVPWQAGYVAAALLLAPRTGSQSLTAPDGAGASDTVAPYVMTAALAVCQPAPILSATTTAARNGSIPTPPSTTAANPSRQGGRLPMSTHNYA